MARGSRLALALVVALVLAGAVPAAGDPTPGSGDARIETGNAGIGAGTPGIGAGNTALQADDEDDQSVTIETEDFEPEYDPATVLNRVEELRGLSATQDITLHEYDEEDESTYDARDEFGAIRPAGAEALQLYSNASTERRQPLGYTVERDAEVHVYLMNSSDLADHGVPQEVVLAHELVHALQFQHDLLTPSREQFRSEYPRWTTDSRLVTTALIEGDAMWVTEQYFDQYAPGDGDYTVAEYNRTLARAAWPHSVAGTPYYYGYEFYEAVGSSPDERSAFIEDPPTSTAELLHPGESVERGALPTPPKLPEDSDLTQYHTDTVGELVVRHALRINGLSFSRAAEVAEGWTNDRMYYFAAGGAAGPATHWVTVWESEEEAAEFADAWRSMLDARGARPIGGLFRVPASDHAPVLYYDVEREGETVRITAAERADTTERLAALATGDESRSESGDKSRSKSGEESRDEADGTAEA